MTEENQDPSVPKLKLSRRVEAEEAEAGASETPEPKQELKLKRPEAEPMQEPSGAANAQSPDAGAEDIYGKDAISANDLTKNQTQATEPAATDTPPVSSPIPATAPEDQSARKLEASINQVDQEEPGGKGLLTSIIVIILLLAVLGGSGYGLYLVLKSPDDKPDPAESTDAAPESGPIAKAKAVIASIPGNEEPLEADPTPVEDGTAPAPVPVEAPKTTTKPGTDAPAASPPVGSQAVAELLKNAHIGGTRTGERPMVIMNGQSYTPGDLVDPDSGLRFIGFRDKKLAFRDGSGIVYLKSF